MSAQTRGAGFEGGIGMGSKDLGGGGHSAFHVFYLSPTYLNLFVFWVSLHLSGLALTTALISYTRIILSTNNVHTDTSSCIFLVNHNKTNMDPGLIFDVILPK